MALLRNEECNFDDFSDVNVEGFFRVGQSLGGVLFGNDLDCGQQANNEEVLLLDGLLR